MSGFLIIEWPHGNRRVLDHVMCPNGTYPTYEIVEKYKAFFGDNIDWIDADQKDWLQKQGFLP